MKEHIIAQFNKIALSYDSERRALIPCFDAFYQTITELANIHKQENIKILDIGAGTGLLTQFLVLKYPDADFTLIDIAEAMLKNARERFPENRHIHYINEDYVNYTFQGKFDLIVSALSIHHLIDSEKMQLYKKVFAILEEDGVFINGDQFYGTSDYNEKIYQEHWAVKIASTELTADQKKGAFQRMQMDKTATVEANINWLKDCGFRDIDLFYKYYNFGIIRCRK